MATYTSKGVNVTGSLVDLNGDNLTGTLIVTANSDFWDSDGRLHIMSAVAEEYKIPDGVVDFWVEASDFVSPSGIWYSGSFIETGSNRVTHLFSCPIFFSDTPRSINSLMELSMLLNVVSPSVLADLLDRLETLEQTPPGSATSDTVSTDTTNFNTNLSAADDTVQKALDTLDDIDITDHASLTQNMDYANAGHTGFASEANFTTHTGDATIHFTVASIDHTAIANVGTNSHAQIDTHIADTNNPHTVSAAQTNTNTANFNTNLSAADTNVQLALETLDDAVGGVSNHANLSNLDYASAGHTGFLPDNSTILPSQDENDALQGTDGIPSNTNRYVTNTDPRNSDSRTPTAHKTTHSVGQSDELTPADIGAATASSLTAHTNDTNNPHSTVADDVLPTQVGHAGEYLTTDGANSSWASVTADSFTWYDAGNNCDVLASDVGVTFAWDDPSKTGTFSIPGGVIVAAARVRQTTGAVNGEIIIVHPDMDGVEANYWLPVVMAFRTSDWTSRSLQVRKGTTYDRFEVWSDVGQEMLFNMRF